MERWKLLRSDIAQMDVKRHLIEVGPDENNDEMQKRHRLPLNILREKTVHLEALV